MKTDQVKGFLVVLSTERRVAIENFSVLILSRLMEMDRERERERIGSIP